jgi:hypothetical protein
VIDTLFVLGAGFSNNAGLPLQRDFTDALLEAQNFSKPGPSRSITRYLGAFVADVFGHARAVAKWPELEDLFTCVDLAANTGHHLGSYAPADLRTVRRALISRIIRMLRQNYQPSAQERGKWDPLSKLLRSIDYRTSAFVVLNWDTVLEDRLSELEPDFAVKHGNGIQIVEADGSPRTGKLSARERRVVTAIKMHGSVNWLYCDGCREHLLFRPAVQIRLPPNCWAPRTGSEFGLP